MYSARRVLPILLLALFAGGIAFAGGQGESEATDTDEEVVWIEVWRDSSFMGPLERDNPQSVFFQEELGIGIEGPQIPWNGGTDYAQRLRLELASGTLPDMFQPVRGIQYELAEQGAIIALDDLLPRYAPTLWNRVPQQVWDVVRAASPDGKIYYIPQVESDLSLTGMIRKDWLDRVGLEVPQTIAEYETVLEAFRDQDANGNGDPTDEIPTSGRQGARWMDHLFVPFGVAMSEGYPLWDTYNGEVTYAGVTQNMKDALAWIADLYQRDLLDKEALLNTRQMWDGKVRADRVGSWYHGAQWLMSRVTAIAQLNAEVEVAYLPALSAPGYEGSYSRKMVRNAQFVFSAADEERVAASLRLLDFINDPANIAVIARGYEGLDYEIQDGREVRIELPANTQTPMGPVVTDIEQTIAINFDPIVDGELVPYAQMISQVLRDIKNRPIAGDGVPLSVYEGYTDIENHTLFQEYASLIILGEYEIDRFDEFVERWYASGGEEVTARVREWHDTTRS